MNEISEKRLSHMIEINDIYINFDVGLTSVIVCSLKYCSFKIKKKLKKQTWYRCLIEADLQIIFKQFSVSHIIECERNTRESSCFYTIVVEKGFREQEV